MEQEIKIIIDENGKISAETLGIQGPVCLEELQKILENMDFIEVKKTDEYYKNPDVKITNKQKIKRK